MTLFLKLFLFLTGIASIGSAVGIPLVLTAKGNESTTDKSTWGGGVSQVSITMCSDQASIGWEEIEFGDQGKGEVCWEVKTGKNNIENSGDYSALFKEKWEEAHSRWSTSNKQGSSWKTVCGTHWTISAGVGGEEYLGICDLKEGGIKSFVKKNKQKKSEVENSKEEVKLSICSGQCFSQGSESFIKNLEHPMQDKWQEVSFKSRQKSNLIVGS